MTAFLKPNCWEEIPSACPMTLERSLVFMDDMGMS